MIADEKMARAVLATLAYSDMFSYPLNAAEIRNYLGRKADIAALETCLGQMLEAHLIFRLEELYSLRSDAALALAPRRAHRGARAIQRWSGQSND